MTATAFEVPVWYVVVGFVYGIFHLTMSVAAVLEENPEAIKLDGFWFGFSMTAIPAIVAWPCSAAFVIYVRVHNWYHPPDTCECHGGDSEPPGPPPDDP